MTKTKNKPATLVEALRKIDRQQWEKPNPAKKQDRIKKAQLKLISELIEDYLERDTKEVAERFGLQLLETKTSSKNGATTTNQAPYKIHKHPDSTKNSGICIIKFNNLITDLFFHYDSNKISSKNKDEEPNHYRHFQWEDSAETTFKNFTILKTTWETIKLILFNYHRLNMEYATLPIASENDIYVGISEESSNDKEIRLKSVPNILVYGLIQILNGLPLKYFSICKYEKCRKCIILTTARKIYCTFNNCGSLSSIHKQKQKDIEAYRKKDRDRKKRSYRKKTLAR